MRSVLLRVVVVAVCVLIAPAVRMSPHCAGALLAQQQTPAPPMPPEGNPDHVAPQKGAYCDRSTHAAHACKCHAKCVVDEQGKVVEIQEDPKCRAWCFKDHCRCPADCE